MGLASPVAVNTGLMVLKWSAHWLSFLGKVGFLLSVHLREEISPRNTCWPQLGVIRSPDLLLWGTFLCCVRVLKTAKPACELLNTPQEV